MGFLNKLKFKGNLANLVKIRELTIQFSKKAGLDESSTGRIEMAVDEACANIIIHSYKNDGNKPIYLSFRSDDLSFAVIIEDVAEKFNPKLESLPNLKKHASEYRTHGLGIYLMTKLADEIKYRYKKGHGNKLELIKYKEIPELSPA